ncbi:flavin reductase (DIM6/NTAB) family NADH-FMN oxidoreductase RutF [Murinocardiopsis flavida]|uniref:Flavin reductase (DIM6/NTAB) family NADH-FMN oxidoreductase RutF n=1 Tax=Murinocardiopsis flavida TaxID=645275 RepID=A0A2P8DJR9_9ACTN|nr:flavin reductase (DIM6/NTAB) family NADH-FMN oxidoreductase RutF [Murinocardiopsis flavida]
MSIGAGAFTEAMSCFATGVAVVTVRDDRDDIGSTATSLTSVSADPPIVMLAVVESSYLTEVIDRQGRFAVNVLGAGQKAIAGRFAAEGRPSARLLLAREAHHRGDHSGALLLDAAPAVLECAVLRRMADPESTGDHVVYFASVEAVGGADAPGPPGPPLLRYGGRYRSPQ